MTLAVSTASPGRGLLRLGAAALLGTALVAAGFARHTGLDLFRSLALLSLWGATGLALAALPPWPFRLRPLTVALASGAVLTWLAWPRPGIATGATDATLAVAAGFCGALTLGWYFLAALASRAQRSGDGPALLPALARLTTLITALTTVALLVWLQTRRAWFTPVSHAFLTLLGVLVAEAGLRALARLYQPARLRQGEFSLGASTLLPTLFGETGPLQNLRATLERNLGGNLRDAWLPRYLRALAAPLLLLGLLGLWLGTAVTRVPVDATGVLLRAGEVQSEGLPPGLHLHRPWPWARVVLVPTGRVQEIALGYERDLARPILWAEKHFDGEQNLLVGAGEELLTFNVPVQFRIRDAVACVRRTADPAAALAALGSRHLLALAAEQPAFALMTTDRGALAAELSTRLQTASDRLGLGLEILFVGLKDVHPPVAVAPAYQDVISAEEERLTLIDEARREAEQTLGAARIEANRTRVAAEAAAHARLTRATGETARFLAALPTWQAHPEEFSRRLRLETLETALAGATRIDVLPGGTDRRRTFYLGAGQPAATSP